MNKKVILLVLSLILIGLFANTVSAAEDTDVFEDIVDFFGESTGLKFLTVDLAEEMSKDNPSTEALAITKVLVMLLLFAIIFGASSFIKQFNRNIKITVSLLISILVGVAIPSAWITAVVRLYIGLVILALIAAPMILLIYANFKWLKGTGRGTYFFKSLLTASMLFCIHVAARIDMGSTTGADVATFVIDLFEIFFIFALFYYLIWGIVFNNAGASAKKVASWTSSKLPPSISRKLRGLERWAYRVEKLEEAEMKGVEDVKGRLATVQTRVKNALKRPLNGAVSGSANAKGELDGIQKDFHNLRKTLKDRIRKWALDIDVLAKRVGDANLMQKSTGMITEVEKMIYPAMRSADASMQDASAKLGAVASATDVDAARTAMREAIGMMNQATVKVDEAKAGLTKLDVLNKDVLKTAGQKNIQV